MANVRAKSLVGITPISRLRQNATGRVGMGSVGMGSLGMGTMGMLLVLVAIAMAISFGLKIGPHYMNFRTIQSLLAGLTEEEVRTNSRTQVMELLQKRFKINSLYDQEPQKVFTYKRERGAISLAIDYEVREHLFGNVYVLLDFDESRTF